MRVYQQHFLFISLLFRMSQLTNFHPVVCDEFHWPLDSSFILLPGFALIRHTRDEVWWDNMETFLLSCVWNMSKTYHKFPFLFCVERLQVFQSHCKTKGTRKKKNKAGWHNYLLVSCVNVEANVQIVKLQVRLCYVGKQLHKLFGRWEN